MSKALIIDGNNLVHRVRHKVKLNDDAGLGTGVVYGSLISIASLYKIYNSSIIIVAWDSRPPQFRYDYVPTYKDRDHSNDDSWEDTKNQMNILQQLLPILGINSIRMDRTEADDIMFWASRLLTEARSMIVTTDQDLYQAVNHKTNVFNPITKKLVTKPNFLEMVGIPQRNWLVHKAMVGDSSDKVPGIHGVSDKTAIKIMNEAISPSRIIYLARKGAYGKALNKKIIGFGVKGFVKTLKTVSIQHAPEEYRAEVAGYTYFKLMQDWTPANKMAFKAFAQKHQMFSLLSNNGIHGMMDNQEDPDKYTSLDDIDFELPEMEYVTDELFEYSPTEADTKLDKLAQLARRSSDF